MVINMDGKYYNYFKKKSKSRGLKILTFSKNNQNADVVFLNKKKIKQNFIISVKIRKIIKSFLISKYLSNYIYNILATLTIISNYFDVKKLNHHLFFDYKIPQSRGSIINCKKGSKK